MPPTCDPSTETNIYTTASTLVVWSCISVGKRPMLFILRDPGSRSAPSGEEKQFQISCEKQKHMINWRGVEVQALQAHSLCSSIGIRVPVDPWVRYSLKHMYSLVFFSEENKG